MCGGGLACVFLLLACALFGAVPSTAQDTQAAYDEIAKWVVARGAKLNGCRVGKACATCERGLVATRNIKEDELIVSLPFTATLRLREFEHSAFPAEYARDLLDVMHNDPTHNETWAAFWATQPGPDGVFTTEVHTDQHIDMLQCPELESLARGQRQATEEIYDGSYIHAPTELKPFDQIVHASRVSLDTFKWVASLIGSRYFGFYRDGSTEQVTSHLLPYVDVINHGDDPNAWRSDDGDSVVVKAIKPIKKGEEITFSYQPKVVHRPDMSLYIYGFVTPRERPLLAAVDLPGFSPEDPFAATDDDDSAYDKGGKLCTAAELARLRGRLATAEAAASEEADREALEGGTVTDWRQRAILQFRLMRKRALRQTIERVAEALGTDGGAGADGGGAPVEAAAAAAAETDEHELDDEQAAEGAQDEL